MRLLILLFILALCVRCEMHHPPSRGRPAPPPAATEDTTKPTTHPPRDNEADQPKQEHIKQNEDLKLGSENREEIKRAIWASPLGQMFHDYIFGNAKAFVTTQKAYAIVDRLFSKITLTLTRASALQLLVEDMYEHDQVDRVVNDRLSLLQSVVALRKHSQEVRATQDLLKQTPWFLALGVVGGSPLIRTEVTQIPKLMYAKVLSWFGRHPNETIERAALSDLATRKVFADYSPYQALSVFLHSYGGYALVYLRFRSGSVDSASIPEKVWVYGLQNMLDVNTL